MKMDGITPDAYSFNAPILSFCRMRKIEKAQKLFDAMSRYGVSPDSYTYNALIKALCDERRVDEAKEILLSMESSPGIASNQHTYWPIVGALTKMGHFSEAGMFMNKLHRRNAHLGSSAYLRAGSDNLVQTVKT
jgi:pentatricopeptide repeat protein